MKITQPISTAVLAISLALVGCSDSNDSKSAESFTSEPEADTSYLDELAAQQGIELEDNASDEQVAEHDPELGDATIDDAGDPDEGEEEREWVKERESQSILGRSRDKAKDLRDSIQGSTEPGKGLASTISEDEYAASSGLRWEMPEDWAMAIPPQGHFGEMYIKHPLGNASVSFTKETKSARDLIRQMEGQIIDPMGGRSRAKTTDKTIAGQAVRIVDLEGTYLDPGAKGGTREQIFYAMHAAIFDLGDSRILIKMWGPQDTVNQSTQRFDLMINNTTEQ
jgi:hypothetical protein